MEEGSGARERNWPPSPTPIKKHSPGFPHGGYLIVGSVSVPTMKDLGGFKTITIPKTKIIKRKKYELKCNESEFLERYENLGPEEILNGEAKRSLAVIASIRDEGIDERNRLNAAKILIDRVLPTKQELQGERKIFIELEEFNKNTKEQPSSENEKKVVSDKTPLVES